MVMAGRNRGFNKVFVCFLTIKWNQKTAAGQFDSGGGLH
jgi:hypothetical protein